MPDRTWSRTDYRAAALLFSACLIVYAYFFQGSGWGQLANFDTTRAIVERRTFDITPYADNTGDVSRVGDRVYSNKPPGLPLLGAVAYAPLLAIERSLGHSPDATPVWKVNWYLVTVFTAALPTAVLAVTMLAFLRRTTATGDALRLAGAFAFGALVFPYAGLMLVHNLLAACLFAAWLLITRDEPSTLSDLTSCLLLALAVLSDYLAVPLLSVYAIVLVRRPHGARRCLLLLTLPLLAVCFLAFLHRARYGHLVATTYTNQTQAFRRDELLLGVLGPPDLRRLYWLTFHTYRGLFYCCPVFLTVFITLLIHLRRPVLTRFIIVPLLICFYFLLFNLSFYGWMGGWSVGPRYLIPALPFLFLFARAAFLRFPIVCWPLAGLSMFNMFAVAATKLMYPSPIQELPPNRNPVLRCIQAMYHNQIATNLDSFNLGQRIGLPGTLSLIPILLVLILFWAAAVHGFQPARTDVDPPPVAELGSPASP